MADETCTTCGNGTRPGTWNPNQCSYCADDFPAGEHRHKLGIKVDGLQRCVGHRYLGCEYEEYDSQWGAGLFTDWPRGHHKAYGS